MHTRKNVNSRCVNVERVESCVAELSMCARVFVVALTACTHSGGRRAVAERPITNTYSN